MSQTIAFLGATGDTAGFCLATCLNSSNPTYDCRALARTPQKLLKSLLAKGVSQQTLDQRLTIVQGDVKDVEVMKKTLTIDDSGKVVDKIVCGIGGVGKIQASLVTPVTITDEHICQDAGATVLLALQQLLTNNTTNKPFLINISSTGLHPPGKPCDVPVVMIPIYRYALQMMLADKRVLQERLAEEARLPESQRVLSGFVHVKPTRLVDGKPKGLAAVREGVEDKPAVGYSIGRSDVATWMFERLIKGDVKADWVGKGVCLTY